MVFVKEVNPFSFYEEVAVDSHAKEAAGLRVTLGHFPTYPVPLQTTIKLNCFQPNCLPLLGGALSFYIWNEL